MIWSLVKVMLLSLVLETIIEEESQCLGLLRTNRQSSLFKSYKSLSEREKSLQSKGQAYVTTTPDTVSTLQSEAPTTLKVMTEFKEQIELCRGNYPKMNNQTFYLILYENLNRVNGGPRSIACNVSTDMISKIKLPLFDIFSSFLKDRNDSLLELDSSTSILESTTSSTLLESTSSFFESAPSSFDSGPTAEESLFHWKVVQSDAQDNLELKLGLKWMENMPKVPHLSHIYLGRALYPFITEESRVLDKVYTFPPPRVTEPSVRKHKDKREARISLKPRPQLPKTSTTTTTPKSTREHFRPRKSYRRRFFTNEKLEDSFPNWFSFRNWTKGRSRMF